MFLNRFSAEMKAILEKDSVGIQHFKYMEKPKGPKQLVLQLRMKVFSDYGKVCTILKRVDWSGGWRLRRDVRAATKRLKIRPAESVQPEWKSTPQPHQPFSKNAPSRTFI
ncbi:hypothetical protein [Bacillus sp. FJAT-50079]|uniref:hypothetical protein n=1 Tax=Bacillus sp. FJAT-50079 TaxID=2833577 RepID=UPI001BCA253A|nr:hypothetical protein [Bacillus sp. FJAT-50079]MBS4209917.1 hypothetical protein [Bacillus sp. FJAT-50079]